MSHLEITEGLSETQAVQAISNYVKAAEENIAEAEALAEKYGLTFHFCPAYGMGGTYYPKGAEYKPHAFDKYREQGWYSSSEGCS